MSHGLVVQAALQCVVTMFLVLASSMSLANQSHIEWYTELTAEGSDNFSLRTSGANEVYTGRAKLGVDYVAQDEVSELRLGGNGSVRRYSGESQGLDDFPSADLSSSYQKRVSEKFSYNAGANLRFDRTSADEFEEVPGLGFFLDRLDQDVERQTLSSTLSAQYLVDQNSAWSNSLSLSGVTYRSAEQTRLVDYQYLDNTTRFSQSLNEQVSLFVGFGGSFLMQDPAGNPIQEQASVDSDTVSLFAGSQYRWSELDSLEFSVGGRRSRFDPIVGAKSYDSGAQFSASYTRNLERGSVSVEYRRRLRPTSTGELVEADDASIRYNYAFNERSFLSLRLLGQTERTKGLAASTKDEDAEFGAFLRHRLNAEHSILSSYRHAKDFGDQKVHRNSYSITWRWTPVKKDF